MGGQLSPTGSVVVIGSGPVGAAVARRLAERGCAVTLLETGRPIAVPDLPSARPGEHLRNQGRFHSEPDAFLTEVLTHCAFYDTSAPAEGLPGACETIAFGGQSLVWTNNCPRTQPGLDRWDALDDGEWDRRYSEAEALLHVATNQFEGSQRQRRVAERLRAHLAHTGRRVERLPMAGRADGTGTIRFTATADILADLATSAKPIAVRYDARAVRIEHDAGHVDAVHTVANGQNARLGADAIVVAAGAFATPRLLFDSGIRPRALGRWLHYHPLLLGQLVLNAELSAPPGGIDPPPRLWLPPTREAPWHGMVLRDIGAGIPDEPVDERRLIEVQFFAPVEPRAEHKMTLDDPVPRFDVRLTERDHATLAAMHADVTAIGAALGRWRRGCEPNWNPWGFSHPMGTTRMGEDPTTSVVDHHGRVHGFDNLYLAGVSVIPVAIAVNPTLTAIALALETADAV